MITFDRLEPDDHDRVAHLDLPPEQHVFTVPPAQILQGGGPYDNYVILADGTVVGFFRIDLNYPAHMDLARPGDLGVRAFMVGDAYQGLGHAKAACRAMADMVRANYPEAPALVLTVNCKNPGAYHCYLAGGFVDTGKLYHGGGAGPQNVMRLPLDAKPNAPSKLISLLYKLTSSFTDLGSKQGRRRQLQQMRHHMGRWLVRIRRTVPPGLRSVVGFLLIVGGIFGFLPILGFWMIPLGVAVMALDIRPLWRRLRG